MPTQLSSTDATPPWPDPHKLSEQERSGLSGMVLQLFVLWKLSTAQQLNCLGLSPNNRATLTRYSAGAPIGNSRDQMERVGVLLSIHKNLRLLFPAQKELGYRWMTAPNRAFNNISPVDYIERNGIVGLHRIRFYLDSVRAR